MRKPLLLMVLPLLLGSTCITEPACACSPPGGGTAVITGLVTDPGSSPVAGAAVVVRLVKDVTCEEPELVTVRQARTDESGRFRHQEAWSGGRKCFLVWAEPPAGSPWSRSESTAVRIDFLDRIVPDSVEIRLRLR